MKNNYHNFGKKERKTNPIKTAVVIMCLTGFLVLFFLSLFSCSPVEPIVKAPAPPVSVAPSVAANATALEKAGAAVATIPAQADAALLAAPVVKPQAEAIKVAASVAGAAVEDAKANSAVVAVGIDERDKIILAQKKIIASQADALKKETDRANSAEKELSDRAKNRIEWILTIGGFAAIAIALGVAYMLFQAGSVVRAVGVAATGFVFGSACFAAAVYFDTILTIGAWTLGIAAIIGLVVAALHYRKHMKKAQK